MKRLVLFDIDGTLVTGGPAKGAFHLALETIYGTTGPIEGWSFSGKTDPQIARELLTAAGLDDRTIDEGFPALWTTYLEEMERRMANDPTRVLPGVMELVEALESLADLAMGLVTGNVQRGADLKLGAVGLASRFELGAFGSDHEVRNELPGIAMERAWGKWRVRFDPRHVVVVGDTPRDVACGRHHGTRTLAVATGRFGEEELRASGADVVLPDLSRTDELVELLTR
ncbi:MAG: HAD family hydrolase [Gemmatimonadota bacterium]